MVLPLRWAAAITVACVPLAGTAVMMLGSDPVTLPLVVTAGFVLRHAFGLLNKPLREQFLGLVSTDLLFLAFIAYSVASALVFPRLFEGDTVVIPQAGRAVVLGPAQSSPVQIVYLLVAFYLYLALRHTMLRRGMEFIVAAMLTQIALFGGFGLIQAMAGLAGVPISTSWIVNNQGYALLTQVELAGFTRVTSVFVEASSFAGWATGALGFCYGLYINRVLPKITLPLIIVMSITLILSTSSTAYVGLLCIGLAATVYAFFDSDRARHERGFLIVLGGGFAAVGALIMVMSAQDGLLAGLRNMIEEMTIRKSQSGSGIERAQWAASAIQNALDTGLLGVGYGAARSSGLFHQIVGTVGVPGLILFVLIVWTRVRRMFNRPRTGEESVVCAGAFALCCLLGAQAAAGNDLALSNTFWIYCAIAAAPLAQRAAARARTSEAMEQRAEEAGPTSAERPI
ncbi:MAG: hypothetical protein NW206_06580 [Hyphomonadaceae bacterium]|nr:hypothetical protein [Hyphomonadaceae bacterium]